MSILSKIPLSYWETPPRKALFEVLKIYHPSIDVSILILALRNLTRVLLYGVLIGRFLPAGSRVLIAALY